MYNCDFFTIPFAQVFILKLNVFLYSKDMDFQAFSEKMLFLFGVCWVLIATKIKAFVWFITLVLDHIQYLLGISRCLTFKSVFQTNLNIFCTTNHLWQMHRFSNVFLVFFDCVILEYNSSEQNEELIHWIMKSTFAYLILNIDLAKLKALKLLSITSHNGKGPNIRTKHWQIVSILLSTNSIYLWVKCWLTKFHRVNIQQKSCDWSIRIE